MDDILLDVRELEPPEPLEKALESLPLITPERRVRMLIHREPFMLYDILRREGFRYSCQSTPDGSFEVIIYRS